MYTNQTSSQQTVSRSAVAIAPPAESQVFREAARPIGHQPNTRSPVENINYDQQQLQQQRVEIVPSLRGLQGNNNNISSHNNNTNSGLSVITNSKHHQNRLNGNVSVEPTIGYHRGGESRGEGGDADTYNTSTTEEGDAEYYTDDRDHNNMQDLNRLGTSNDITVRVVNDDESRRQDNKSTVSGAVNNGKTHTGGGGTLSRHEYLRMKNLRPDRIRWTKGKLIAKGALGKVYLGTDSVSNDLLVAKEIKADAMPNLPLRLAQLKIDFRQLRVVNEYQHPNLIQYYGAEKVQDSIFIFSEFVPSLSLRDLLDEFGDTFTEEISATYLKPVVAAVAFLHSAGVYSYDLKARNILVGVDGTVRLCDYGASFIFDETPLINEKSRWLAPEVLRNEPLSGVIDTWSLGCTLLELLTGEDPFAHLGDILNVAAVVGNADTTEAPFMPPNMSVSATCLDFLRCCFRKSPLQRWPICALLAHPFLAGVKGHPKPRLMQENLNHNARMIDKLKQQSRANASSSPNPCTQLNGTHHQHHPGVFQLGGPAPFLSTSFSPPSGSSVHPQSNHEANPNINTTIDEALASLLGPQGGVCTSEVCQCLTRILLPSRSECTFNHLPSDIGKAHRRFILQSSLQETDITKEELESFLSTLSPQNLMNHVIATLHSYENDRIINRGGNLGAPYVQWRGKNWQDDYRYPRGGGTVALNPQGSPRYSDDGTPSTAMPGAGGGDRYRCDPEHEHDEEEMVHIGDDGEPQPQRASSLNVDRPVQDHIGGNNKRGNNKGQTDPKAKKSNSVKQPHHNLQVNHRGKLGAKDVSDNENEWEDGNMFGHEDEEDDADTATTGEERNRRVLVVDIRTDDASTLVHFLPKADVGPLSQQQGTILVVVSFVFMVASILVGGATVLAFS